MHVNNAVPLQPIHPAQQAEPPPHVAIRIEDDAAPPAPQENALPHPANALQNRRPAVFNRMAEGLRHGGAQVVGAANFIREFPDVVLIAASAVQFTGFMMNLMVQIGIQSTHHTSGNDNNPFNNMPAKILGFGTAGTLLALGLDSIRRRPNPAPIGDRADAANVALVRAAAAAAHLRGRAFAGRPIAEVVGEIRGHRAGSSASASRSFDWTQAGLFVDRNGIDQTAQVSYLLNRILQCSIKEEEGTISSTRAALVNNLLDALEKDPEHRSGLANQVEEINESCINRTNMGFNIMMQQLDTHGLENMTPKNALLHVIGGAVKAAADKELLKQLPEPKTDAYQAIHHLAAEKLREKIPDFHLKIEDLKYASSYNTGLNQEQVETIAAKAVEQFNDPMQIAQCLFKSPAANKQMEDRFTQELEVIGKEFDKQLDEKCNQFTNDHERDPGIDEMAQLAMALEPERQEAIKECYAQLIADASLFKH